MLEASRQRISVTRGTRFTGSHLMRWLAALSKTAAARRCATSVSFLRFGHTYKQSLYTADLRRECGGDAVQQLIRLFDADNATEAMLDLLNEHAAGKTDHNYRLRLLVNLELWYRLFIEGAAQDELHDLLARGAARKSPMFATAALQRL